MLNSMTEAPNAAGIHKQVKQRVRGQTKVRTSWYVSATSSTGWGCQRWTWGSALKTARIWVMDSLRSRFLSQMHKCQPICV